MTLIKRIYLLLAAATFGLLALAGFSAFEARLVFNAANFANENSVPALLALDDVTSGMSRVRGNAYRLLLARDAAGQEAAMAEINKGRDGIAQGIKLYEPTIADAKDRKLFEEWSGASKRYLALIDQAVVLQRAGKGEQATELLMAQAGEVTKVLYDALEQHVHHNAELAERGAAEAQAVQSKAMWLMLGAAVVADRRHDRPGPSSREQPASRHPHR